MRTALALAVLLAVLTGSLWLAGRTGLASATLEQRAEAVLSAMSGRSLDVEMGPARLSVSSLSLLSVSVSDARFSEPGALRPAIEAGEVRFGLRFLPMLRGELGVKSISLSDARLAASTLSGNGSSDWTSSLFTADGLIDPDAVPGLVFEIVEGAFAAVAARETDRVDLESITLLLPNGQEEQALHIDHARLKRIGPAKLHLAGKVGIAGLTIELDGVAERDGEKGRITALDMTVSGTGEGSRLPRHFRMEITGAEAGEGNADRLDLAATLEDFPLDFGDGDRLETRIAALVEFVEGAGKVEFRALEIGFGRSLLQFHGAIGPAPRAGEEDTGPVYRYDFVSDGSTIAPLDSPEPALGFLARIAGHYDPVGRRLLAEHIGVRTGPGELIGSASLIFPLKGGAPSVALAIGVPKMPVQHAKQLWPWFSARGARKWVLNNVFGGEIVNSAIRLAVPPNRLGNGVPLSAEEVSGHFRIAGTRFDIARRIPPVRDAIGVVRFAGSDVDIALDSGTIYLPSGHIVDARDGTFLVRNADQEPAIGLLDIAVSGEAAAVAELSSYEPMRALEDLDVDPGDFTGTVKGRVKAEIPLQADVPIASLEWLVDLEFDGLAVAKPFGEQMVSEAAGRIIIDPAKAHITTRARLNGIPASLDLIEPLGRSVVQRKRDVALELDDDIRDRMMPALAGMIQGTVIVRLDDKGDGVQLATADLTGVKLSIPGIGWSKGAGIAAELRFAMEETGSQTILRDLVLDGGSFNARGTVTLREGSLQEARFDRFALNRQDAISLTLKREGKGYDLSVRGSSFDGRALVKSILKGGGRDSEDGTVSVTAEIGRVIGFHGQVLEDMRLTYSRADGNVGTLALSAETASGGVVAVSQETDSRQRSVTARAADAGALLRFLDIYSHMEGGRLAIALSAAPGEPLAGTVEVRDFWIVDEPKLGSLVASAPQNAASGKGVVNASRVRFERGFVFVEKGEGYLAIDRGVLRGPEIGATFQGIVYDRNDQMDVTGTFMPLYGLNRIFGELPLIGQILGNGRDRGLIGITFRLAGDVDAPRLQINPLSAIAPGIFRSIFEFR
jgi:hypothetical protein